MNQLEGEIPLLDADRLDDHKGKEAEGINHDKNYGTPEDTRAVLCLIDKLRKTPSGQNITPEELEDKALSLYGKFCQMVLASDSKKDQLEKISELLEEDINSFRKRLLDDEDKPEGGASALLRALS